MNFEAITKETIMRNPQKNMAERRLPSEIRIDPLTGRTARVCHFMELKWKKPDFDAWVKGTQSWCPFCPDKVMTLTPCFPGDLVPEGRLQRDDMVIFPNIAPYDSISAVATFGARHFIPMTAFTSERIAAALDFALEFFRRVARSSHSESVYHMIHWNYMPPSGSTVLHPHLQVFSSSTAPNLMRRELVDSRRYQEKNGTIFWDDLVAAERKADDRYLAKIGRTHFLSAYAPMGVVGDVLAVVEDVRCTLQLSEDDLMDIAAGIVSLLGEYDKMGLYSFNMGFFTGTPADDHFRFHLRLSPRTFFSQQLGTPDVGAMQYLLNESVCLAYPETINASLKKGFTPM
ncbi:MAG: hypothetical protein HKP58_15480 [Desulfatitalea sp.]|nr:hypothetical protein [Desulfatitalea sp.]NNK01811.1 hypothetical protein [Desulfatitalea sp.]